MKEKFQYLAFAFVSDHLQNDIKQTKKYIYLINYLKYEMEGPD